MRKYKYLVLPQCYEAIYSFYYHVALKYRHTYSEEQMLQNIDDASDVFYKIEDGLLRREPTLSRWKGLHMANTDKWYYAYTIDGDTITIVDACHAQNMKEGVLNNNENEKMEKARNFRNYKVWQDAVDYSTKVYQITDKMPWFEKKGLCDQLKRAAVSISSNIA